MDNRYIGDKIFLSQYIPFTVENIDFNYLSQLNYMEQIYHKHVSVENVNLVFLIECLTIDYPFMEVRTKSAHSC